MSVVSFNQTHHANGVSDFMFSENGVSDKTASNRKNQSGFKEVPTNKVLACVSKHLLDLVTA